MEKIINSICELEISANRIALLKKINYFLWVLVVLISYNKWVRPISIEKSEISWEAITGEILTGNYIELFKWTVFIVLLNVCIRYVFISVIPKSRFALTKYLEHIIPAKYRRSLLNVFYKSKNASPSDLDVAIGFSASINQNDDLKDNLGIILDVVIKGLIMLIASMHFETFLSGFISIFSIVAFLSILFYCSLGLVILNSQLKLKNRIDEIKI